jgi:hypothetical protein
MKGALNVYKANAIVGFRLTDPEIDKLERLRVQLGAKSHGQAAQILVRMAISQVETSTRPAAE